MEGLETLKEIIYGRVDPHIYAFETNTVPSYLKVGDTYRPVEIRLSEWRQWNGQRYKDLRNTHDESAKVGDDFYFRDYSVHKFLTGNGFEQIDHALHPDDSMEFFKNAHWKDVEDAIADIQHSFDSEDGRYSFYRKADIAHEQKKVEHYERNETWEPRQNQQEVIDRFVDAVKVDHTKDHPRKLPRNLLMYAVMRFGKSFTALCCAEVVKAKLVVVVCGKTDVRDEWQQNVEKPTRFKDYLFVTADDMKRSHNCLSEILKAGKRAVVFLSLQDLLGDDVKEKHEDLFRLNDEGKLDMLIVDETHYAARSSQTGKVLKDDGDFDGDKEESIENLKEHTKHFRPQIATLHLSGTPYRILLDGEFDEKDIIATVQYSDIIADKQLWDEQHLNENDSQNDYNEWENPYYGFPQMVRFAFNLNESSIRKLQELGDEGITYKLNHLLEPMANSRHDAGHRTFRYEHEVLELMQAIDGTKEDSNIFGFLDYDRIRKGNMCHHIVLVLPFKGSCDAMKRLLENNKFNRLNEYKILNISGFDAPARYNSGDYVKNIKEDITGCESKDMKTITLTVGRMLTGSTVKEWDTMIYLRDTTSPQAYDQAIFRLQSQYITTYTDPKGCVIKKDMKPQTLLVDFDPIRMFELENEKALVANTNQDIRGNENLAKKLRRELDVSPIIWLNANKLQKVEPVNIANAVRNYQRNRSLLEEALGVEVDRTLFNDPILKEVLNKQPEMDENGGVFRTKSIASDGDGDDVDLPGDKANGDEHEPQKRIAATAEKPEDEAKSLSKRLQTYYFKMMLFAYLSDKNEKSVNDIIVNINSDSDCRRIARNLELDVDDLKIIRDNLNPRILNKLENRIFNTDELGNDPKVDPESALRKFGKISRSEIVTPQHIASEMISNLPDDVTAESRFLDIAAKEGEFAYAIVKRYGDAVKGNIYSIPTSGVTYECTRKIYSILGMPIDHIFTDFTSYQMIAPEKKDEIMDKLKNMNFDVVVGNPPYQEMDGGARSSSKPIYQLFVNMAKETESRYMDIIIPARWYAGGKGLDTFRTKMLKDRHISNLYDIFDATYAFPNIDLSGGVCYFIRNKNKEFKKCNIVSRVNDIVTNSSRPLNEDGVFIRFNEAVDIIDKIKSKGDYDGKKFDSLVSSRKPFGISTNDKILKNKGANTVKIYAYPENGYYRKDKVDKNTEWIDKYKVFISYAYGERGDFPYFAIGKPFIGKPGTVCTETYLVISPSDSEEIVNNIAKYLKTKFVRTLVLVKKNTQHATAKVYEFVPLQDFTSASDIDWSKSVAEIDKRLYKKYGLEKAEIDFIERTIKPMK